MPKGRTCGLPRLGNSEGQMEVCHTYISIAPRSFEFGTVELLTVELGCINWSAL
jgi:hypothetical protein